jgi:class 3 adenylate cyclase
VDETTPTTVERKNRTRLATVLFADIVGFSERSVGDQNVLKQDFNSVFGRCLRVVLDEERLLVDTGDGLAACFFGDPEDGLLVGLAVRDELAERAARGPRYDVRLGINLGPIMLVTDLNGRTNAVGDGINVAQRIMSFSDPGQLLVSRTYYEVVSRISDDYERMFAFLGVRHDKHVREHNLYEVRAACDIPPVLDVKERPPLLREEQCARLAKALARHIGPLAAILVRRACRDAADLDAVLEALAPEVAGGTPRAAFLAEARDILGAG